MFHLRPISLSIREAFIAFELHPSSRQRSRIGFASSDKHLDMGSFFFTEVHWSGLSHLFFSCFSSVYHKNQIGLTTRYNDAKMWVITTWLLWQNTSGHSIIPDDSSKKESKLLHRHLSCWIYTASREG